MSARRSSVSSTCLAEADGNLRLTQHRRSHIFRAYVDSNSTRRLGQLADRVLVIIDSVMTILCVKEDKTSFDRIAILLSNRSGCILDDVDARSATIVVTSDSVQNFFYERGGKFDLTEFTLTFDTLLESHLFRRLLMQDDNILQTEILTCKNPDASTPAKTVSYMANGKPPNDQATSDPFVKAGKVLDSVFDESARARSTNLEIALHASQEGKHTSRAVVAVPAAYATVGENSDEDAPSSLDMMRGNEGITLAQRLAEARPDPTLADSICSANDNDFAKFSTTNASLSRTKRTYRKSKIANNRSAQTAEINTLVDPRPMHDTGVHGPRTTSLEVQQLKQASSMPRAESVDQGMVSTVRKLVNKKQNDQEEKGKCHDIEPSESLRDSAGQNHGRNLGQIEESRTGHTRLKTRTRKSALDPTFNDKKAVWEEPAIGEPSEAEAGLATKKSQSSARTASRKKKVTQKASRFKVSREEVSLPESTASVHVVTTLEPEVSKSGQAPALDQHDKANSKKFTPQQDIADGKGGSLDRNIVTALDREGFTGSAATPQFDSPDKSFAAKLVNITRPHIIQMKAQLSRPTASINQARMDAIESDAPGAELMYHGDAINHAAAMSSTEPSNDPSDGGENPTGDVRQDVQGAAADTLEDANFCALKPSNDPGQNIDERCAESLHSGTAEIELRCDQFPEAHADHGDVVMSPKAQPLDRDLCDSNDAKTTSSNIDDTNRRSSMDAEGGSAPDPSMNRRTIPIQPTACTVRDKQLNDGPETARPHNESRNARHNINASSSGRKRTTSRLTGRDAKDRHALRTPIVHFSENGPTNRGTPIQRRVSRGLSAAEAASEGLTKFATTEKVKARPLVDQNIPASGTLFENDIHPHRTTERASISESELIETPAVLDDAQTSNREQERDRTFLFREQLVANNIVSPNDAGYSKLISSSPGQEQSYSFDTEQLPGSDQDSGADLVDVTCKDTDLVDSRIVEPAKEDSVVPTERSLHLQQRLEEFCSEHSLTTEQKQPVMATTVVVPSENFTTSRFTAAQPNVPSRPEHITMSRIHGMKRIASVPSDLRAEPRLGQQNISDAAWLSSGIMHNKRKLNTESMPPPLKPAKVARIDAVSQFSALGCENIASVLKHDTTESGESRSSSIAITRLVNESNICVQTKKTSQNEMAKQHTSEFSHVHSHAEIPPMPQTTVKSLGHSKYHDADKTLVGHVRFQDILSGLIPGVAGNVHSSPVQSPLDSRIIPAETEIGNHPGDDLTHQLAISMRNMFEVSVLTAVQMTY